MPHQDISDSDFSSLGLAVTNHISAMLAYWDKDLVCRFANAAYLDWFGKTQEEMIGKIRINELLGPLYEKNLPFISGALRGEKQTFEREIKTPSGELRYSIANYFPEVKDGEVMGFFVHVADITPIKLLEKQLIKTKELEVRNKELQQFAYITSHDLQEPLRTISNYIQLIKQDYGHTIGEEASEYLSTIEHTTTRMSNLIKALLNYSRLGKFTKKTNVNLSLLMADVLADLDSSIKKSGAIIHIADLPIISASEIELHQVFLNLISNAIKFTKNGIQPQIYIDCEKIGAYWQFSVKDNGIGIDPKHFERIFIIFQSVHAKDKYGGYGIGLANTKKIIEMHGGEIWVESSPEKGSVFYFTILNQ